MNLNIAKEFTETPGPRSPDEGDFSGEEFLIKLLLPRFEEAVASGEELAIDLDGTEGYATSFLEAAFGGLARKIEPKVVLSRIRLKSDDEPYLIEEIHRYIEQARDRR